MNQPEKSELPNRSVVVEDLTVRAPIEQEVKGGNGGLQRLGSARLLLQQDSHTY